MSQCQGIPKFPREGDSSEQYQKLFNEEAVSLGFPMKWTGDKKGGNLNIPDLKLGELQVTSESEYQLTETDICTVRASIETKRQTLDHATRIQMRVLPSQTLTDPILKIANPAEQQWLRVVADDLQEISLTIYGLQANYNYEALTRWMSASGNPDAQHHYRRIRSSKPPRLDSKIEGELRKEFKMADEDKTSPSKYANLFPWFESLPKFNTLLPKDMTDADKEYLSAKYGNDDPIRLPWTVVENASTKDLATAGIHPDKISQETLTKELRILDGKAVSWLVKGNENHWYKVTNMALHPRYQEQFKKFAQVLKHAAKLPKVGGSDLDPTFKAYTLKMADSLEKGEFQELLEADLNQTKGNLFLTFFPHEGYWPDGMKFPWMLEMGIRQPSAGDMPAAEAAIFQVLEDKAAKVASEYGLSYSPRHINTTEISKSAILFWPYRTGGFLHAYPFAVTGHDYPKRVYKGITLHRNVVLLDTLYGQIPSIEKILNELMLPEARGTLRAQDFSDFVMWHEGTHGTGARADTPTQSGRTMSDVYGDFWGQIAEPLADAGSILAVQERFKAGLITTEERNSKFKAALGAQFKRYIPKNLATGPYFGHPDAPHLVGSDMLLGWLFKQGAIKADGNNQFVVLDEDKCFQAVDGFFAELTKYSLTDDLEGFKQFSTEAINSTPDAIEARIMAGKDKYIKPLLINRSPNPADLLEVIK